MMNDAATILIWSTFGASAFVSVMCLINLLFFRKAAAMDSKSSVMPAQVGIQTVAMDSRLHGNDSLVKPTPHKAINSFSPAIQISVLIPRQE